MCLPTAVLIILVINHAVLLLNWVQLQIVFFFFFVFSQLQLSNVDVDVGSIVEVSPSSLGPSQVTSRTPVAGGFLARHVLLYL